MNKHIDKYTATTREWFWLHCNAYVQDTITIHFDELTTAKKNYYFTYTYICKCHLFWKYKFMYSHFVACYCWMYSRSSLSRGQGSVPNYHLFITIVCLFHYAQVYAWPTDLDNEVRLYYVCDLFFFLMSTIFLRSEKCTSQFRYTCSRN